MIVLDRTMGIVTGLPFFCFVLLSTLPMFDCQLLGRIKPQTVRKPAHSVAPVRQQGPNLIRDTVKTLNTATNAVAGVVGPLAQKAFENFGNIKFVFRVGKSLHWEKS